MANFAPSMPISVIFPTTSERASFTAMATPTTLWSLVTKLSRPPRASVSRPPPASILL
jgi:hypothetical protein